MHEPLPLSVALVGATGAVGQEILRVLDTRRFPVRELRCFASARSKGKVVRFRGADLPLLPLSREGFSGVDVALFSAGRSVSAEWVPIALEEGARVIDNGSLFRMDPRVPLVIPEINAQALQEHHRLAACPNCSTILMLMVLAPLHRQVRIRRIVAATYQAASGAGYRAMRELEEETRAVLQGQPYERQVFPYPYAFNLFPHNSPLDASGYAEEEIKMREEARKIVGDPDLQVHATCIRVPVLRAHSEALNVTFEQPMTVEEAYALLRRSPGVEIWEDRAHNRFPMPCDATGQDEVFCGRIRLDPSHPNTLDFWVVGDQLRKGAALNTVQIAEQWVKNGSFAVKPSSCPVTR